VESDSEADIPALPESGIAAWLPGLWILGHYRRRWLGRDVAAGLVLTALLVPAGMAYAQAAGLPAISGLYATIGSLLAYAVFGPSRIMVLGPDSALAAMIAAAVEARAAGDPARAAALASVLAVLTAVVCAGAGLARLGVVTDLLSKPVRVGYMNGIALTMVATQLPRLFGLSEHAASLSEGLAGFIRGVTRGETRPAAVAIGAAALAVILAGRRLAPRVPWLLLAIALAAFAMSTFGFPGIAVVGPIPRGLQLPSMSRVTVADLPELAIAAVGIALVSFADTSVLSRVFAGRSRRRIDPNRELLGLGAANLAAGLLGGFPVSSSASRTPVAESAGSRTQLTGVVGALTIVVLLLSAPRLFEALPTAALAAVVISAALRMFDFESIHAFRRVRRSDFVVSIVSFLSVAGLGVLQGIGVAVTVSLLDVVRRAWHPHDAVLGHPRGVTGYHDVQRYPDARQVPGLLLFRWDAPLFFANADTFRERIVDVVDSASEPLRWIVVAAEPITDVDTTAAEMLEELDKELATRGAELAFAEMKDPVKDRLQRYGLRARIGHEFFFPTVGAAVEAFVRRHQIDWPDAEAAGRE
jgi:high affinity sulfate transporter 1